MANKKTEKKAMKVESKSAKRRIKEQTKPEVQQPKDSNAEHEGAKYRVTFLCGQSFRGVYRQKGDTIDVSENDAKAYSMRSTLKIEQIEG